jgi:hypothetical protein
MAKKPEVSAPPPPNEALTKEALERLEACEKQKTEYDLDIREAYYFAAPHRARDVKSGQAPSETKPTDSATRNTSIASEVARDFVTEVMDAFMPQADPWAERKPGMFLPKEVQEEALKKVNEQDPVIFAAIRASNFYEVAPMAFVPDLPIGLTAIWIEDLRPSENIVVQAVPLRELECNVGPFGDIDDRFVVRHTRNRHVEALLGTEIFAKVPVAVKTKIKEKPAERTALRWGYWRLWDRRDDIVWQHVVMVDKIVVHYVVLVGEGCCPLVPIRFNPSPEWACGNGPLIEALEDFRLLDTLEADKIDHIELALRPPTAYPDDSFAAVENGIEPGSAYPVRPGSENAVKAIFEGGNIEAALFETAAIEDRIKRKHFLGFPQQRGKTPPTATQWLDEMLEKQRRIGTPGMPFWREGPAQIFLRFKYLLEKRGIIEPVKVDGKTVALTPYNPAQRAAEQQEVAMAVRALEICMGMFPEEAKARIDGGKTMVNIIAKTRANLIEMRDDDDLQAAVALIAQLMSGGGTPEGGAPAAPMGA